MHGPEPLETLKSAGGGAPPHEKEFERLASLCGLHIPEKGTEPLFDELARQAAAFCGTKYGLVSIVREHDQTFLGKAGLSGDGTDRNEAICAYTILQGDPFVVEDTLLDPRFIRFVSVRDDPRLRFYAGVPIFDHIGLPLGSLCVFDTLPREIGNSALFTLQRMAAMAGVALETRRFCIELLGPNPRPVAVQTTLKRLDRIMAPLFDTANGFRRA